MYNPKGPLDFFQGFGSLFEKKYNKIEILWLSRKGPRREGR